jgi:hypothetical protein
VQQSRQPSWRIWLLAERHGVPCIRPGATSRVAVWELLPWSSCVRHLEGRADGRPAVAQRRAWRRLVAPYSHSVGVDAAVPGMASWWRGWPHRADGDERDTLHWSDITALSWVSAEQASAPPFEGSSILLRGCGASAIRKVGSTVSWSWHWPYRIVP